MRNRWLKLWPWAVMLLALILCAPFLMVRLSAERTPMNVELIMDVAEVELLSRWWGTTPEQVLLKMKRQGLTSVSVPEMTLDRLRDTGRLTLITGAEVLSRAKLLPGDSVANALAPHVVAPGYTYAITDDRELAEDIVQRAARRPAAELRRLTGPYHGYWVVEFGGSHELLLNVGLGFDSEDIERVNMMGLLAVPRPRNVPDLSRDEIIHLIDGWSGSNLVISYGYETIGYPEEISTFAAELDRADMVPGFVESPKQLGFIFQRGWRELAQASDYGFVRVFTITQTELELMSVASAGERYVRAAKERNIRALYLRPITAREYQGRELEATVELVGLISGGLDEAGFTLGPAQAFPKVAVSPAVLVAAVAGIMAATVVLVGLVLPAGMKAQLELWFVLVLCWLVLLALTPESARLAAALAAAVVFPVVAVFGIGSGSRTCCTLPSAVGSAVCRVAAIVACSVVGGLFVTVILGDSRFMLEVDYFQGVKLSYVLPVVLAVLVAGGGKALVNPGDWGRRLKSVVVRPVTIGDLVFVLVIGSIAYVYLVRSGHDAGLSVPNLEIMIRDGLERMIGVRPRFKEYLIGIPALVIGLTLYAGGVVRTLTVWQIVGVTGQVSIINSFAHLRTPAVLTLLRTVHGLWLGAVIGVGVGVMCWMWLKSAQRIHRGRQRCPE